MTKKVATDARSSALQAVPLLVADVFHLAGVFRRRGEEIARLAGRTQAEWQLLSALADGARTVPQIARRLGYTRQSVQRTADSLTSQSLLRPAPNPDHKKSPLLELTKLGRDALDRISEEAEAFHSQVVRRVGARELLDAERFLRSLCNILDPTKSR